MLVSSSLARAFTINESDPAKHETGQCLPFAFHSIHTFISSLWKVKDDATRKLMERYYQNHWEKKMGKLDALREAQIWMLREGGQRGLSDLDDDDKKEVRLPPYFWAAFVLSGDWR